MKNVIQTVTNNFEETQDFAKKIAKDLKGGEVLCLFGDLGYGKTTFIQGLAKGLGVDTKVMSPTFIIMRSYQIRFKIQDSRFKMFYHVDLYRMNREEEVVDLGLLDIVNKPENIVAIEWPEKMGKLLPKKRIEIKLDYTDENSRFISVKFPDVST